MKPSLPLVLLTCALIIPSIRSHIIVRRRITDQLIEEFYDLPALFGDPIPSTGLRVYPLEASPDDGCQKQLPPSKILPNEPTNNKKFVLIIARNNCTFEEKIRHAQEAQYDAAIVYNMGSDDLEQMSAKNSTGIKIPSVFVGETSGRYIIDYYINDTEFVLIINDALPFNINKNLIIPFSILVGLCFIAMIFYIIYKCVREQRRLNQHRLPKRLLKKIPVIKFTEGLPYETCIICLEEYSKGERIRVLPCNHAYHCHCVDVWLTKNRRVCPICKRKVFVKSAIRRNQPRSEIGGRNSPDSSTDTDDDVQPLMNTQSNQNDHGTFPQNDQNDNNGNGTNWNIRGENGQSIADDVENVLNVSNNLPESSDGANNNSNSRRENPFNRNLVMNSNPVPEENIAEGHSFWNFFKFRFLRRSDSLTTPLFNEVENPFRGESQFNSNSLAPNDVQPISVNVPTASNNILNMNLSGSFQDNTRASSATAAASAPSSLSTVQISNSKKKNKSKKFKTKRNNSEASTSNSQQRSSSSTLAPRREVRNSNAETDVFIQTPSQGGIGVAALPNRDLNPNPAESGDFFL